MNIPDNIFWDSTLKEVHYLMECYSESYNYKIRNKIEMIDYQSWLSGVYIAKAIQSCFSKSGNYPEKPFGLKEEQKPMTLEEARRIEENKIRQYMSGGGRNGR